MQRGFIDSWIHDYFSGEKCFATQDDIRLFAKDLVIAGALAMQNECVSYCATAYCLPIRQPALAEDIAMIIEGICLTSFLEQLIDKRDTQSR